MLTIGAILAGLLILLNHAATHIVGEAPPASNPPKPVKLI